MFNSIQRTILITGGLGYIGCHVVIELLRNSFKIIIVDDLSKFETQQNE